MSISAMKEALEALEYFSDTSPTMAGKAHAEDAITLLHQAIKEAEKQEPVAKNESGSITWLIDNWPQNCLLYTNPQPKREWVGLTDDEINEAYLSDTDMSLVTPWVLQFGSALEAKLKEKNNG